MKAVSTICLILLFWSCEDRTNNKPGPGSDIQPTAPQLRDSIQPVINSYGDTLLTGVPVILAGRTPDPDGLTKASPIPAGKPKVVPAHQNIRKLPTELRTQAVHVIDLLKSSPEGSSNSNFVLRNSTGDSLPTGIPIPTEGKVVPCIFPQSIPGMPPGMKDNASMDLRYLDVYHGMLSSQVISIIEDNQGRIWLGTTGGGVSMYNGHTFTHFGKMEGLSGSWITCILEDHEGKLWFGTLGEGLIVYDGETFRHYTEKEGLSNNTVECLLEDRQKNLWIGSSGGGISKLSGQTFTHYTIREGLSSNWVQCISEDSKGLLWIGTAEGVNSFDGEQILTYSESKIPAAIPVSSIVEDSQGRLWIGTNGSGAILFDQGTFTHYTEEEGLSHNSVECIVEDSQGILWIGTTGGGVNSFDGGNIMHIAEDQGLSGTWVITILEDSSRNLWFGTIGGGVSILNNHSFIQITENEGLSSRAVYSILEDTKGRLWFGTMFGGLSMYDGTSFYQYTGKAGLSSNTIESILEDSRGNLWFGTGGGGVIMFDGQVFRNFTVKEGFCNHSIGSILEDRKGNIWFGSYGGGVIKFDGETFTHYSESEGFSNNVVESMLEDRKGRLWFGTLGGGVSLFDGVAFTHLTKNEGLSSNLIGSMTEDRHGNLWFGSMTAGAMLYDGATFSYYTGKEGLKGNLVQSIIEDKQGNIWLSTEQGLNLIKFDQADSEPRLYSFGLQDGLKGMHFLQNSVLQDDKGRIWWGSNKSLTMLDMNNFQVSTRAPRLQLNRIDLNGAFVDFRHLDEMGGREMEIGQMARFNNYPGDLKLPHHLDHLSFHFSAIDWSAPHKIRYRYKVEGFNENWSRLTAEPKAEYRNLGYGSYTFMVQAMGEAQIWSEPFEYSFSIKPPWWHSWWARSTYGLLGILLVIALIQWRTFSLRKRQKELENTVQERTLEISEKNEELNLQNEHLASQRDEIQDQKDRIEKQKQAITDSIEYAKRIQTATLPPDELMIYMLPKHFILYKPLDIVSGDFYWLTQKAGKIIVAVADCTGHGVPGAFMSMLGSALLNDIVNNMNSMQAHLILNELRDRVIASLRQTGKTDEARDGMDIALCILDKEQLTLQYAGAHQPLYHVRKGQLTVVKADMMPIGISSEAGRSFTNHEISLLKDDAVYMCSDGYVDQLGGDRRKRFTTSRFKSLLLDMENRIMHEQKEILDSALSDWMGLTGLYAREYEQIDDVIVLGLRV